MYTTLAITAFIAAVVLLARVVSVRAAMANVGIVVLLAMALALQAALDSPAIAYAAFALAAVSFGIALGGERRHVDARSPPTSSVGSRRPQCAAI